MTFKIPFARVTVQVEQKWRIVFLQCGWASDNDVDQDKGDDYDDAYDDGAVYYDDDDGNYDGDDGDDNYDDDTDQDHEWL